MSAAELAAGTRYSESLSTGWRPPSHIRSMTEDEAAVLRKKWYIYKPPTAATYTSLVMLLRHLNCFSK
jgi:hypothetical protein